MAITIHGSSSWTDGGTTQDPYASTSFTPPAGSKIYVCASAFAASGDDLSTITVTGGSLTWTKLLGLDQLNNGGSVAPPPIAFYSATASGAAITVTQECVDGIGFSHVQGITVVEGGGAVIDTGTFTGTAAASISLDATAAGQLALFGMCDWGNATDTPVKSNVSMTTRKSGASADVQTHLLADLFTSGAGPVSVGTNVLASPAGTNAIAILIDAGAAVVSGAAALTADGSMTVTAVNIALGAAALLAQSSLIAAAMVSQRSAAAMSAESNLTASATVTVFGAVSLSVQSNLTATAAGGLIIRPDTGIISRPFTGTITRK